MVPTDAAPREAVCWEEVSRPQRGSSAAFPAGTVRVAQVVFRVSVDPSSSREYTSSASLCMRLSPHLTESYTLVHTPHCWVKPPAQESLQVQQA